MPMTAKSRSNRDRSREGYEERKDPPRRRASVRGCGDEDTQHRGHRRHPHPADPARLHRITIALARDTALRPRLCHPLTRTQRLSQGTPRCVRFYGGVAHEPPCSRLAPARRRARFVKVTSAGAAVAGFGVLSVLVRGAHPGSSASPSAVASSGLAVSSRITQEAQQNDSFFQSGSVAPSQPSATPQASTRTS